MPELPLRFPQDPYCRAGSRLLLTLDETGACFIGLTPDGAQPGRDMLARLTLWRGDAQQDYKAAQEDGAVVLRAGAGCVRLSLGFPERVAVEGEGVSLLIGKGRAAGMFMSGGSAVDDSLPGALYVNAGARMRILPETGSVEVRSAWNLNALSDPDPRIFLHPDADGALRAEIYVTDFDSAAEQRPAPEAAEDFERFLNGLIARPEGAEALHAACVVWSCLQPARRLAAPQISAPLYVSNRRTLGTAMLSDNVLLAALLADPAAGARQMCAFLPYLDENGLPPRAADNRSRLYEAETPYFGAVLRARPDILAELNAADYAALARALDWWRRERRCPETGHYFYLHRYEPGLGRSVTPEALPEHAPLLNACMRLWLEAMAAMAERLGKSADAAAYRAEAAELPDVLPAAENVPAALELPLLLAGEPDVRRELAARICARPPEVLSLRRALTVLAAELTERGMHDAH